MVGAAYFNPMAFGDLSSSNGWVYILSQCIGRSEVHDTVHDSFDHLREGGEGGRPGHCVDDLTGGIPWGEHRGCSNYRRTFILLVLRARLATRFYACCHRGVATQSPPNIPLTPMNATSCPRVPPGTSAQEPLKPTPLRERTICCAGSPSGHSDHALCALVVFPFRS